MGLFLADLDKEIEVEVTEFPEPINGHLFEAVLRFTTIFSVKSSGWLGYFNSPDEARWAAKDALKAEKEERARGKEVKAIQDGYISKTRYRL